MLGIKIIIGATSFVLLLITLELIRREKLKEKYALLWIFTCLGIFLFSFTPPLVRFLSEITGMYYLSIISMVSFIFLLLLLLHFSVVISKLHERNKALTQQHALLRSRLDRIEAEKGNGENEKGG